MNGVMGVAGSPRSVVVLTLGGKRYTFSPLSWNVIANGHGVIDSATVSIPITQGSLDLPSMVQPGQGIPIEIWAGFPADPSPGGYTYQQLTQRFIGTINQTDPTFSVQESIVSLPCNSYGAILTRTKTTTNVGGATASTPAGAVAGNLSGVTTAQYVASVASQHGMTADVQVNNPASMQQVFTTNQIVGIKNMRIWDVIMACASTDGAYAWFSGKTLHYVSPEILATLRTVVAIPYASLVGPKSFDGSHALQYSKNIKVEVRSWSTKDRTGYSTVHRSGPPGSSGSQSTSRSRSYTRENFGNPGASTTSYTSTYSSDGTLTQRTSSSNSITTGGETSSGFESTPTDSANETYIRNKWGMTQAECDAYALTLWRQLSGHEFRGTFTLPVTPQLLPNVGILSKFRIHDLPWSSFDQDYLPLRITEDFSLDAGYTAEVLGINHQLPQGIP